MTGQRVHGCNLSAPQSAPGCYGRRTHWGYELFEPGARATLVVTGYTSIPGYAPMLPVIIPTLTYTAEVVDLGSFTATSGALTPNQVTPGKAGALNRALL